MKLSKKFLLGATIAAGCVVFGGGDADASSHREAPFVTRHPKIDSTDFYMFMSPAQTGYVTILANYDPFQENFGGPNYYELDPDALYEIHVDNNGDGKEDITFQFNFHHALANSGNGLSVPGSYVGGGAAAPGGNGVPVLNIGPITAADTSNGTAFPGALNVQESYDLTYVAGDRRTGTATNMFQNQGKPVDYIGDATFGSPAAYEAYALSYKKTFKTPGCDQETTAWVGQRREGFAANVGVIFDLVQGPYNAASDASKAFAGAISGGTTAVARGLDLTNPFNTGLLYNKNITTLALEVPVGCLIGDPNSTSVAKGIIGGWTSASMHQARVLNPNSNYTTPSKEGGAWTQVSHLGMPLVNEVVIGLKDKDTFGAVSPVDTSKVAAYVTNPTLPALLEILYGAFSPAVKAPTVVRADLVAAFATGLTVQKADGSGDFNLNQTSTFTGAGIGQPTGGALPDGVAEYLRLNTNLPGLGVPVTTKAQQIAKGAGVNDTRGLGAMGCLNSDRKLDLTLDGCDPYGFPNGRRPSDDVVDIALRVVMGALIPDATVAPGHNIPFTDVNYNGPEQFNDSFPYLRTPLAGSQNPNQSPDSASLQQ